MNLKMSELLAVAADSDAGRGLVIMIMIVLTVLRVAARDSEQPVAVTEPAPSSQVSGLPT